MHPPSPSRNALRKPFVLRAAACVALVTMLSAWPGAARAQEVSLRCMDGSRLAEADLARGATIVVVWASWSPRSRDIVERVKPLADRWGERARVVTVNFQENRGEVERFLSGKNLGAPVCLDPEGAFSRKYNVATLPGLLVMKDGQVAYRGKLPPDADAVISAALR